MAGNTAAPGESVADRLFRVLECFDTAHPQLSLTQVSEMSGLPLSTARRLLGELTRWGGLERLVDNKYRVGIKLWKIGALAPQQRGLREAALPSMHDLFEATQETVQLTVLDGHEALCIEKIFASTSVPNQTEIGGRLPLHATAVGKCLLAFSPQQLLVDIVELDLVARTPHTITQPARLAAELRQVRRTGVALSEQEMTLGVLSVASPIIAGGGLLRGALGVVARAPGKLAHLAPAVRTAALTISRTCT